MVLSKSAIEKDLSSCSWEDTQHHIFDMLKMNAIKSARICWAWDINLLPKRKDLVYHNHTHLDNDKYISLMQVLFLGFAAETVAAYMIDGLRVALAKRKLLFHPSYFCTWTLGVQKKIKKLTNWDLISSFCKLILKKTEYWVMKNCCGKQSG